MRIFVATTATSAYIIPETACYQRGQERNKDLRPGVEDEFKRIFWKVIKENNWKPEDFAAKETKEERFVFLSINVVHSENVKPG